MQQAKVAVGTMSQLSMNVGGSSGTKSHLILYLPSMLDPPTFIESWDIVPTFVYTLCSTVANKGLLC